VSASGFEPTAAAANAVDAPPRSAAVSGVDDARNRPTSADVPVPADWADQWDAPVVNADAVPVGAMSDPRASMVAPLDPDPIAATPPARLSAQARYRRAQAGDESFGPQFVRTRPTWPEGVLQGLSDTGRMMTTPPLPPPAGSYEDDAGFRHPGNADPDAWEAFVADQRTRADLGPRTAIDILTGGAGFARRGALGAAGGGLRRPALAMDEASRMARARRWASTPTCRSRTARPPNSMRSTLQGSDPPPERHRLDSESGPRCARVSRRRWLTALLELRPSQPEEILKCIH